MQIPEMANQLIGHKNIKATEQEFINKLCIIISSSSLLEIRSDCAAYSLPLDHPED